ncbi:hypothetical protein Q8W71_29220 [Methylobacterium sp. NEAU 140]|uniref:hypothetical protein n=1 Tax=Methylobacterium sp. NEAU 140 TaxID=3064945 RepID=UPI002735E043|nr:hypothetical protein [Methylobacterium sp. NEAU 140]MDP4026692.1 hypothetical protein [Methylobacterium sp. NEAU 140]
MRELIALVRHIAREASAFRPKDRAELLDRITELEAEAVPADAPSRTLETIRRIRRQIWVDGLIPRSFGLRGH